MSDFALAKVSVFSNLPIVYSEMVLCFIFPMSRDLHANTFRELLKIYGDLIRHMSFHFPTTGNFTLCKPVDLNLSLLVDLMFAAISLAKIKHPLCNWWVKVVKKVQIAIINKKKLHSFVLGGLRIPQS